MAKINVLLLIAFTLLLIQGCNLKESVNARAKKNKTSCMGPHSYAADLKLAGMMFQTDFWQGGFTALQDSTYCLAMPTQKKTLSEDELLNVIADLGIDMRKTGTTSDHVMTVVLYSNVNKERNNLNKESLIGLTIYYNKEGKLHTATLKEEDAALRLQDKLSTQINAISLLDMYRISKFIQGKHQNITSLVLTSGFFSRAQYRSIRKNSYGSLDNAFRPLLGG